MNDFEKIKNQIAKISSETDSRKGDLEKQIASVNAELEQAKVAEETAVNAKSLEDFQKQQATIAMLTKQLENLHKESETIECYAPITADEHNAIKRELHKITKGIIFAKYQALIDLLDDGSKIVAEIEETIKEYHSIFGMLDYAIGRSETDVNGVPFNTFSFSDCYNVPSKIKEVFCDNPNSIHSVKYLLKNNMQSI